MEACFNCSTWQIGKVVCHEEMGVVDPRKDPCQVSVSLSTVWDGKSFVIFFLKLFYTFLNSQNISTFSHIKFNFLSCLSISLYIFVTFSFPIQVFLLTIQIPLLSYYVNELLSFTMSFIVTFLFSRGKSMKSNPRETISFNSCNFSTFNMKEEKKIKASLTQR